jgi:S1-C subfamily serine protease
MIRRWRLAGVFVFILVFWCPFASAHETSAMADDRFAALIESVKPAIVAVGTYYFNDKPKAGYLGTGFVIRTGKHIVTNFHVVSPVIERKKLPYLRIFHKNFSDKGIKVKMVAKDEFHDLALLEQDGDPLPALDLADSSTVKEGHRIAFTGYPIGFVLGLNPTTHTGIISSIAPLIRPSPSARIISGDLIRHLHQPYDIFQIDAMAYPGNSGSPVYLARSGKVIGVINKVFVKGKKEHAITDPSGITYAIPANFIRALEDSL